MKKPLVSIACITYNHEKFIQETLEGFLMQKTDFPYEILIHDDASTDETVNIIKRYHRQYPDLIKPVFQTENQWSKLPVGINARFNFPRAQGKYIAFCEGDDRWTDPYKLQKQIDFLEKHSEYILCGTDVERFEVRSGKIVKSLNKKLGEITLDDMLYRNPVSTCTAVFRNIDFKSQLLPNYYQFTIGDWPLWCSLMQYGKAYNLPDVTARYHIHQGGMVSGRSLSKTLYSKLYDRILLCENFPDKKRIIKKHGYRILLHYIKNALKLRRKYMLALWRNKKIIWNFIRK